MLFFLISGIVLAALFILKAINTAIQIFSITAITIAIIIVPDAIRDSFLRGVIGPNTSVLWGGWLFFLTLTVVWLKELGVLISAAFAGALFLLWLAFDFDTALTALAIAIYIAAPGAVKKIIMALIAPSHDKIYGCILYGLALLAILAPMVSYCANGFNDNRNFDFLTLIISAPLCALYVFASMRASRFI